MTKFNLYFRLVMNVVWGAMLASDVLASRRGWAAFDIACLVFVNGVFIVRWTPQVERPQVNQPKEKFPPTFADEPQ